MVYMGSKRRLAKYILPIILKNRKQGQAYVEPFCGGCNLIDKVDGLRYANDNNQYLIALLKHMAGGHILTPLIYEWRKKVQEDYRAGGGNYTDLEYGYAGFIGTFSGRWNCNCLEDIHSNGRAYIDEHCNNLNKQAPNLKGIIFSSGSYNNMDIPDKSIIYCDGPYRDTAGYKDVINYDDYYNWLRLMSKRGHQIFVSEYNMPDDFTCIYEKELLNTISPCNDKKATEKLFILNSK